MLPALFSKAKAAEGGVTSRVNLPFSASNIMLSDVSPGKLSQAKSERFLLLVLFGNFCYLLILCMAQQPSSVGSTERDTCVWEFLT